MVEEYLEKLYQELYEKKLNLEQEKQRKEVELNNNIRFIETLKESLDEEFESFSPRKVDEDKHMEIKSLMKEQKKIIDDIDTLKMKKEDVNAKIEELKKILEKFRQEQRYIEVPSQQSDFSDDVLPETDEEKLSNLNSIQNTVITNLTNVVHKIEICNKLAEVDTLRCKLELQKIEKSIKEIIQKIEKI